jgi:hypothetical protein
VLGDRTLRSLASSQSLDRPPSRFGRAVLLLRAAGFLGDGSLEETRLQERRDHLAQEACPIRESSAHDQLGQGTLNVSELEYVDLGHT